MKYLVLFFVLMSCSHRQEGEFGFFCGESRKKQKVIAIQKKLDVAEKSLLKEQNDVSNLRWRLTEAELSVIESQIDLLEMRWKRDSRRMAKQLAQVAPNLLSEEREHLYQMLQIDPHMPRAQVLLDRILQIITQISDAN